MILVGIDIGKLKHSFSIYDTNTDFNAALMR